MQNILSPTHNGYSDAAQAAKQGAHRSTASLLRKVAAALGLAPGSYDIRSNEAGIAVPGEVILHGETIYIQVGGLSLGVLVRSCKGRRDYSGGPNNWIPTDLLSEPVLFAERVKAIRQ